MLKNIKGKFVTVLMAAAMTTALAGCDSTPRLDASTRAALENSINEVSLVLGDEERAQFHEDLQLISESAAQKIVEDDSIKSSDKETAMNNLAKKVLSGKSAKDIAKDADKIRKESE